MKAHEVQPGFRFLDEETGVVYRVEQVKPPEEGRVTIVTRYTDQNRTKTFTFEADAEVGITKPGQP